MDPEIKRKLDDQLASGQVSVEEYKQKITVLNEADAFLAGHVVNFTRTATSEEPAPGWVQMWATLCKKLRAQWSEWDKQWNESRFRRLGSLAGMLFWGVAPVCYWIVRLSLRALA